MGAEDILKIAQDTRKTFLEESRKFFGGASIKTVEDSAEAAPIESVATEPEKNPEMSIIVEAPEPAVVETAPESATVAPSVVETKSKKEMDNKNAKRRINEKKSASENEDGKKEKSPDLVMEAIKTARQEYARTEFREQQKMKELEKESGFSLLKIGKKYPENPTTKSAREAYENVLKKKMDLEIAELEARNMNGEYSEKKLQSELKELYTYYNVKAAHELYNARTEEIIAFKKEDSPEKSNLRKGWDRVSLQMTNVANWYNKEVPFWVKGGLAVGSLVAGAGAFTTGKRVWGALIMATTGGMQLDAASQFVDKYLSDKGSKKNIKEVTDKEGVVDFDKFKGMLDGEIKVVDKKLSKYVTRSKINKTLAVGMALVFGSLAFSSWAHAIPNGDVESAPNISSSDVAKAKLPEIPKTGIFAETPPANTPLVDSLEHPKGVPANFIEQGKTSGAHGIKSFKDAIHTPSTNETLTIEKGSSIEKTLIDHIKKIHPGMKNPGHAAHRMWLDYMHDNKAEIIKKVGDSEYGKMLKDGMVNVKPGTTLIIDEHNPLKFELKDIGGKISHLEGNNSVGRGVVENGQSAKMPSSAPTQTLSAGDAAKKIAVDVASQNAVETQQHIATGQEMFQSANVDYTNATDYDRIHGISGDGPSQAQYDAMQHADDMRKAAVETVESAARAKELYFKSIKDVANNIYKTTGYKWDDIKDLDYSSAYADKKLNPIIKQTVKEFKKEFGGNNLPNNNAAFGKWLYRIKEISIKKRLGIFAE